MIANVPSATYEPRPEREGIKTGSTRTVYAPFGPMNRDLKEKGLRHGYPARKELNLNYEPRPEREGIKTVTETRWRVRSSMNRDLKEKGLRHPAGKDSTQRRPYEPRPEREGIKTGVARVPTAAPQL